MRTWAFVSEKGGSGKSTLATQLAVHATECGERAIIVDLDPQGSAEFWHQQRGTDKHPGAVRCLPEKLQRVQAGARDLGHTLMLVDTVPHTNRDALIAIRAADLLILPSSPGQFDLQSLGHTAHLLSSAEATDKAIAVINRVPPGKSADATYSRAAGTAEGYGLRVAKSYVCHRLTFVQATDAGRGVTELEPTGPAAAEIRRLWLELSKRSPVARSTPRKEPTT